MVPHTARGLRALYEGVEAYERVSGRRLAEGIREMFAQASPEYLGRLANTENADEWTLGFAVIHRAMGAMIGSGGFKGPPLEGVVEIAYGIAPAYRRRGYATEVATALVTHAFSRPEVTLVRAHTLPQENGSPGVLRNCRFQRVADIVDPEDGPVWRWERARPVPSNGAVG